MSGNRRRSLWIRIIAIAMLCLLPVAALTFYLAEMRRADELARVQGAAQTAARMLARQIADLGRQTHIVMQGVAQRDPDTAGHAGSECARNLREVLDLFPLFYQLAVVDAEGSVRCSGRPVRTVFNVADRPYFQRAVSGSGFVLSQAILGRDSGRWTLIAAQPLNRSDGVAGVVLGAIDLDWLQKMLHSASLPAGAVVSVVDAAGTIIGRVPDEKKFVGNPVSDPELFRRQIGAGDEGLSVVRTLDDIERIVAYSRVADLPFYVRVGLPKADIDALARQVLGSGLIALFTVLAIGLAGAVAASHYLVGAPMRQLGEAARRLGRGDMSARTGLDYRQPIVGGFARKLDELAALGQRVTRALKTLSAGNRTLLRETDEQTLLDAMCRVAVERGGYLLAMVNFRMEDEAKSVVTVARYGRSDGYIENLQLTWADTERGRGTVGTAIRTGERCIMHSFADDDRAAPWREAAIAHGFGSIISLPLRVEGTVIGTLTLFAADEDAFDSSEVELLDEMAADLSFGISVIRPRLKRLAAEQAAARLLIQDRVTDLPNRAAFMDSVQRRLAQDRLGTTVIIVHLPQLQEIFDCFGYNPGSAVIREIGQKLRNSSWTQSGLARIAFNDIAIVLPQADP